MPCGHCNDEGWVCEEYPALVFPHDDCPEPGIPCPECNAGSPPRRPPSFVSFVTPPVTVSARMAFMSDDSWMFHGGGKTAVRHPKPGERLFEFVRASDRAPMSCELRFHGESYGWEVQFLERGEMIYGHGAFPLRALAVAWAEQHRETIAAR